MKYIVFTLLAILFISCSTVRITHLTESTKINDAYLLYSLPKTKLVVDFEILKLDFKAGPYAAFAKDYLGINNPEILKSHQYYYIKNVKVHTITTADTSQTYLIKYRKRLPWKSICYESNGLISGINCECYNQQTISSYLGTSNYLPLLTYNDNVVQSVSNFVNIKIDTIYKTVKVDTNWIKIPIKRQLIDTLSIQEASRQVADFIFDLRERQYDLFTGDMNALPSGNAAEIIDRYLKEKEAEYLALFIGKTFVHLLNYRFELEPNDTIFAFFHTEKGLVDRNVKGSFSLALFVEPYNSFSSKMKIIQNELKKKPSTNYFIYRLPAKTKIIFTSNNNIIYQSEEWIYQYGEIIKLPISILKKYSLDFHNPEKIIIKK